MFINMDSALLMLIGKPRIVYVMEIQSLISEYMELCITHICIMHHSQSIRIVCIIIEICEVF